VRVALTLIILGNLDFGIHAINDIEQWYTSVSYQSVFDQSLCLFPIKAGLICRWADDSWRFILGHFDVICDSPSEIYHYALPFSPSKSWLREFYSSELSQEVKVVKGLQTKWGICFRTVSFNNFPQVLAYWKDFIAVGFNSHDIIILNAITGISASVLSGHTFGVNSLTFSLDGRSLVSGSDDRTIKFWDLQTGGVIRTFYGHTDFVLSVSISPDCTMLASGSKDETLRLWNVWTGECHCIIDSFDSGVGSVSFSPTNPQLLISASYDNTVQLWTINGHHAAFSSDGTYFVSWGGDVATIWSTQSGVVVAKIQVSSGDLQCCCFSPDSRFIAGCTGCTTYVWDITSSDPHLVETFVGHSGGITSLAFSSSLVSISNDQTIKFWQVGALFPDLVAVTNLGSTPFASAPIASVSLQVNDGIALSSNSAGEVQVWDILTGLCKMTFCTPAQNHILRATQLVGDRLIFVWCIHKGVRVWDSKERGLLPIVVVPPKGGIQDLGLSRDGSRIYVMSNEFIKAWSTWTGEVVGEVVFKKKLYHCSFIVDDSRVWVCNENAETQGWDFGIPGLTPVPLPDTPPGRPHLDLIGSTEQWGTGPSGIEDTITRKKVFQFSGRHAKPTAIKWDSPYLVAGYPSGEVLILNLEKMVQ